MVTYLLQVKDRHNGNILLCSDGHIVHIDFGFVLGLSPGAMGFERAPFKLTAELIEVMEGVQSPLFAHFRELFIRGMCAARAHRRKIIALVKMTMLGGVVRCFFFVLSLLRCF